MSMKLDGAADLVNDLAAMAAAFAEDSPVIRQALEAGAEPIHRKMKQNASSDPKIILGTLHGSIRIGPIRKRGTGRRITVGVHHAEMGAYYANPVEWGHGGPAPAPAHPFVRPAFDSESDTAYEDMKNILRAEIDRRA